MMLVACGNIEHENFVELANKHFNGFENKETPSFEAAKLSGGKIVQNKEIEQVHVALNWEGITYNDELYYSAQVWNVLLGGGMSSRLFQTIREEMGLAYSVFSYSSGYSDSANFGVYAATSAQDVAKLLPAIKNVLKNSCESLTEKELNRAKTQIMASIRMAQESTDSRMGRAARNQMVYNKQMTVEEALAKVEAVTIKTALQAANKMQNQKTLAISAFGAISENEVKY